MEVVVAGHICIDVIPELHGHLLRAWLEQMTSPRRLAGGRDGEVVTDDTLDVSTGAQNLS